MARDLSQFFDTNSGLNDVEATFKTSAGEDIRTAIVIFTDALDSGGIFDLQAEKPSPFIQCQTSDLKDVDHSSLVTIDKTTYRVVGITGTGIGTSIVRLAK